MGRPVWGKGAHHDEAAAAVRAAQCLEPVDALEKVSHRFEHQRIGRRHIERGACRCEPGAFVHWGEQSIVANALEAAWQHVGQEAADELGVNAD